MSDIADNADQQVAQFTAFALAHKNPKAPSSLAHARSAGKQSPATSLVRLRLPGFI